MDVSITYVWSNKTIHTPEFDSSYEYVCKMVPHYRLLHIASNISPNIYMTIVFKNCVELRNMDILDEYPPRHPLDDFITYTSIYDIAIAFKTLDEEK